MSLTSVGGMVGAGYLTFGICQECGVQSPPVQNSEELRKMGWKVNHLKYNSLALCPVCWNAQSKAADKE